VGEVGLPLFSKEERMGNHKKSIDEEEYRKEIRDARDTIREQFRVPPLTLKLARQRDLNWQLNPLNNIP